LETIKPQKWGEKKRENNSPKNATHILYMIYIYIYICILSGIGSDPPWRQVHQLGEASPGPARYNVPGELAKLLGTQPAVGGVPWVFHQPSTKMVKIPSGKLT